MGFHGDDFERILNEIVRKAKEEKERIAKKYPDAFTIIEDGTEHYYTPKPMTKQNFPNLKAKATFKESMTQHFKQTKPDWEFSYEDGDDFIITAKKGNTEVKYIVLMHWRRCTSDDYETAILEKDEYGYLHTKAQKGYIPLYANLYRDKIVYYWETEKVTLREECRRRQWNGDIREDAFWGLDFEEGKSFKRISPKKKKKKKTEEA